MLAEEHEVPRSVSEQVVSWFGDVRDGLWAMDVDIVVKEVGLGILRNHKVSTPTLFFLEKCFRSIDDYLPAHLRITQYPRTSSSLNGLQP